MHIKKECQKRISDYDAGYNNASQGLISTKYLAKNKKAYQNGFNEGQKARYGEKSTYDQNW